MPTFSDTCPQPIRRPIRNRRSCWQPFKGYGDNLYMWSKKSIIRRATSVCLFLAANAVWGLACITITRRQSLDEDPLSISAAKLIGCILAISLPTVLFVTLHGMQKKEKRFSFDAVVVAVILGICTAVFLGEALGVPLSFFGVRSFLGIPIDKWS